MKTIQGSVLALVAGALVACGTSGGPTHGPAAAKAGGSWARFGYNAARQNAGPARTGITAANARHLVRQRIQLDGTVDSSAIYLRRASVRGARHDVFFVTTTFGKLIALDAVTGRVLWRFVPSGYSRWAGSSWITQSSPIASSNHAYVYSASPDGRIHKVRVSSGREVRTGHWPAGVSKAPGTEKIGTALNLSRGLLLVGVGGHNGDAPPYQGHVVSVNARSGRVVHVWNALCSNRHHLLSPSSCPQSDAAVWARAGVVVVPHTRRLLVATGNGHWDGHHDWGDSVVMLTPKAGHLLQNWTPRNQAGLNSGDVDLGSTAPAILSRRYAAQSGKDGKIRLLGLRRLNRHGRAGPYLGGERQTVSAPGGDGVFTAPAVWKHRKRTWLYVANSSGIAAFRFGHGRLHRAWSRGAAGTSPVEAGGLLYVYEPDGRGIVVYKPTSGKVVATLPAGGGHWQSPIVTDGRVIVGEGDGNEDRTSGVVDIYRVR
jgi:outer membrane protein assembly factor BamB